MADVITRFKLETTQFDSKLRDTAKALQNIAHQAELGGKDFNNFSQKSIEAARALGTVQSGAKNTKDKLRDLVGSYNDASKAYNKLSDAAKQGEFGKALSASLQKLQRDIKNTKKELYELGDATKGTGNISVSGSGLSDAMSGLTGKFFKGNIYAMAAEKGLEALQALGEHIMDVTKKANELAIASEGVRNAFNRLDRPDLLKQLREATHGTVSDFELMKAAVKFNDFKLPLDQLGTMLAFAQKKAKDTNQSIDYMVDSIVTGLGRKSLPILDNLGLSATQIRDKMKETGDMTTAVGEIIREQMEKSGDYVETTSDRMARSAADVENAMLKLGVTMQDTFNGVTVDGITNQLELGLIVGLNDTIDTLGELKTTLTGVGLEGVDAMKAIANASEALFHETVLLLAPQLELYNLYRKMTGGGKVQLDHTPGGHIITKPDLSQNVTTATPRGGRGGGGKVEPVYDPTSISYQQKVVQDLTKAYNDASAAERDYKKQLMEEAKLKLDIMTGRTQVRDAIGTTDAGIQAISAINFEDIVGNLISDIKLRPFDQAKGNSKRKTRQQMAEEYGQNATVVGATSDITNGVNGILSGIEQMGIEIPQELKGIMSGIQGVMTILTSINTILGVIEGLQTVGVLPFFARGGIVPHAASGYEVPGTHYSGDVTPIMANAGEVVLTRAQAGSLAADIQNGGGRSVQVHGVLRGEDIILSANRTFKRKGQGEIVTW